MANAPNTRFSATNVRAKEPKCGDGLSKATPNGEVEGPRACARLEPPADTFFHRRRRHYRLSRTPPTIVRARH
jgi:hypothetical protein